MWLTGEFREVFETDKHWGMMRGNRWIVSIPNYGVYRQGGQWGGRRGGGVEEQEQELPWCSDCKASAYNVGK